MVDEIKEDFDMFDRKETMTEYDRHEQERRRLFFEAMKIPDDGRLSPVMTRDEFFAFHKKVVDAKSDSLHGKKYVEVYFEFAPYHDISYLYCFDDDTVYESRFYIGE